MNKKVYITIAVILVTFSAFIFFSTCENCGATSDIETSNNEQVNLSDQGFRGKISPSEFKYLMETGEYTVLDLRTQGEYNDGHISEEPLLLDYYEEDFKIRLNELDKDGKYLIYCNSGNRSSSTVPVMESYGFTEFYELEGGITLWKDVGLQTY